MKSETKAMICTAAVLIACGIFKELAAVCLITAVVFAVSYTHLTLPTNSRV